MANPTPADVPADFNPNFTLFVITVAAVQYFCNPCERNQYSPVSITIIACSVAILFYIHAGYWVCAGSVLTARCENGCIHSHNLPSRVDKGSTAADNGLCDVIKCSIIVSRFLKFRV